MSRIWRSWSETIQLLRFTRLRFRARKIAGKFVLKRARLAALCRPEEWRFLLFHAHGRVEVIAEMEKLYE